MKILYFSAYYKPEIAASSYIFDNIKEALTNAGHEIILYAPMPTRAVSTEVRNQYKKKKYEEEHNGKLKIYRFSMFREGKNPLVRAFRYFCCSIVFLLKGLLAKDIDVIMIGSTPPIQGAMAAILKKFKKVPVIFNLQDIFPDSLVNTGLTKKGSILFKIGRIIEDFTYKNVDKIIVISEDFKQNIMAKGVPEEKIEIVYNWVDENSVFSVERENNILINRYNLDPTKFFITYCGNVGFTQNLQMLGEVAKELEKYDDIQFIIIGDGAYSIELEKQIIEKKINNLLVLPFQPYEDIANVFSIGDVGLIISKANVGQNSVPSKTWSIMSASRAVLASFDEDSELCSIIRKAKCGVCVEADNKNRLKEAILSLYNNREEIYEYGKNGRKYILENLTREVGTSKIVKIMSEVGKCCDDSK